jgi:hypothetical protein
VARALLPAEGYCPDFIQFWTAARLLLDGQDPYDPALQAAIQGSLGWNRAADGLGVYDFLPYYYPPWMAFPAMPLLGLDYLTAKMAWLVLGAEALVAAGVLAAPLVGAPVGFAVAVTLLSAFSIKAVAMGQVAPFVLLLFVAAWRLLEDRRDAAAGAALALAAAKPQLAAFVVAGIVAWSIVRGRLRVVGGMAAMLALLAAVSTALFPAWLPAMVEATRTTPMPTAYYPGIGTTTYSVLAALGLEGPLLVIVTTAAALPLLARLARAVAAPDARVADVMVPAVLLPFFVAPYARPYDFAVLSLVLLVLAGRRAGEFLRLVLVAFVFVVPGLHMLYLAVDAPPPVVGVRRTEFTLFWFPLLLAAAGLVWTGTKRTKDATGDMPGGRPSN